MMSSVESNLQYLLILRVLATAAVVFGHAASFFDAFSFTQWPHFPYVQSIAVTIFFAVSGYTIAWLIDSCPLSGLAHWIKFIFDRFMRLSIPLVPILFMYYIVEWVTLGSGHPYPYNTSIFTLLGNSFYLQNMVPGIGPFGLNRPLWTVSIEFWIYVAFSGVMYAIHTRRKLSVPLLVSFISLGILVPYVFGGRGEGLPLVWLAGAGVYYFVKHYNVTRSVRFTAALVFCLSVAGTTTPSLWPPGGTYSLVYNLLIFTSFGTSVIMICDLHLPKSIINVSEWLGRFAYTLYLTHYPVQFLLREFDLVSPGTAGVLSVTAISYLLAWVISLPVEQRYKMIRLALWRILKNSWAAKSGSFS
jgi:peptidoglycan/LPS O-acetylase OafA/YrhL